MIFTPSFKRFTFALMCCMVFAIAQTGAEDLFSAPTEQGKNQGKSPVFIELFTSQNCPSCPPADHLLETLSSNQDVIALGCHVTYWDNGRPDALANPACTERQKGYVERIKGHKIFTPQIVINGKHRLIGSRKFEVMQAVIHAQKDRLLPISITRTAQGATQLTLPPLQHQSIRSLEGIMIAYDAKQLIKKSGTQSGFMHYVNPVKAIINYGPVSGLQSQGRRITLPRIAAHTAFIIQNRETGAIIAAGAL